jgi:hypothetical protein
LKGEREPRLVCCLLPKGAGVELLGRLFSELGIAALDLHSARGFMGSDPRGLFNRVEKDVLSAIVPAERADEVFDWLYREGRISEMEGRFLYVARLSRATSFVLPAEVPLEGPA